MDIHAVRVEKPTDVQAALRDALAQPGPALVDLVTDPRALALPPKITGKQIAGFTTAMSKEILGGGMGEVWRWPAQTCATCPAREDAGINAGEPDQADSLSLSRTARVAARMFCSDARVSA